MAIIILAKTGEHNFFDDDILDVSVVPDQPHMISLDLSPLNGDTLYLDKEDIAVLAKEVGLVVFEKSSML